MVYGLGFRLRGLGFHGALQGFCGCLLILFLRRIPHTYTHMHTYIHTYIHTYVYVNVNVIVCYICTNEARSTLTN